MPTQVITMLSLVLYELGTNALKYGAWSAPKGVVSIGWLARDGTVTVEWKEHDGLPIKTPHKLGAGAKLIRTAIPDAVVDYRLERDGARCKIELPLGQRYSRPKLSAHWCFRCTYSLECQALHTESRCSASIAIIPSPPAGH